MTFDILRVGSDNVAKEAMMNGNGVKSENGNGHVVETERGVNFCEYIDQKPNANRMDAFIRCT